MFLTVLYTNVSNKYGCCCFVQCVHGSILQIYISNIHITYAALLVL